MSELDHAEGTVRSADGTRLHWQRWTPAEPRAAMLLVHGLGEHSGRYAHVAAALGGAGLDCWGLDYRAHGRSPGLRVHVDRFEQFVDDLDAARRLVRAERPELPLFVLGHSQGGLIAASSVVRDPTGVAGLILSSPFLGIHPSAKPSALLAGAARLLSRLLPTLRLDNGVDPSHLSHDPAVVEAYRADPLVSSKVSARWFTEILDAQARALEEAPRLAAPALVMQSGGDLLVDPEATRRWADRAPGDRVELVFWDGLYHEMLNEPEQGRVLDRIVGWVEARLGDAPS